MSFKVAVTGAITSVVWLGCIPSQFAQLDWPVVIQGVSIGLLDERCTPRTMSASAEKAVVDLDLTMRARNTGLMDATLVPGRMAVMVAGIELPAAAAEGTTIIRPGDSRTFNVRFEGEGAMRCDAPMAVVLDGVLETVSPGAANRLLRFRGRGLAPRSSRSNL